MEKFLAISTDVFYILIIVELRGDRGTLRHYETIMIMFCRGTKTSINIDNMEERKIQEHFNFVTAKLEKLHKNLMWNMFIGRSYLDKIEKVSRVMDEISLDSSEVGDFDVGNPKTWSKECLNQIEATLQVNEIPYDGIVSVFSVLNDVNDRDVDSDEVKINVV